VGVDEHTIELAGSPVFYRRAEAGAGAAEPLYLHGIPTSSDQWIPMLDRVGGIAPDLPGFGRSSKAGNLDYTIDGHARFVEQLLEALGIERVALVVHGWGAAGGLVFAQRNPGRVTRLVLCNALPLFEGLAWPRIARLWRRPLVGELAMGSTTRWLLARTLRQGGNFTEAQLRAIWTQFDQGTQRAILRLHRATDDAQLASAGAGLGELSAPSLVLWGERDPWLGPQLASGYAERLPNARLELLGNARHWPWLDDLSVVERVAAFLEST
jgi:pimeloyl-ACP methyl ester carboxylesterase